MSFQEKKKQAELDGMIVNNKTTKADIEEFYETKETVEIIESDAVKGEAVTEEPKCPHKIKGEDAFVFSYIQTFRHPDTHLSNGTTVKGKYYYKKVFVCDLCAEKQFRD